MPRPRNCFCKNIKFDPKVVYFKPQGVPMRNLQVIELSLEEIEAYRLSYINDMDQNDAAKKMNTSQSTYQRMLAAANGKIAEALVHGKAIKIVKHKT